MSLTLQAPAEEPGTAPEDRSARVKVRTIELMGQGLDPVDAAMQAERENPPEIKSAVLKVEFELRARDAAFLALVCKNEAQLETLLRKLIAQSRHDFMQNNAARYKEITAGEANSVPAHLFAQKGGAEG